MNPGLALVIFLAGVAAGAVTMASTDIGPWFLNLYARAHGGTWYQKAFLCTGCNQRHHVGRPGPLHATLCVRCSAAPQTRGTR